MGVEGGPPRPIPGERRSRPLPHNDGVEVGTGKMGLGRGGQSRKLGFWNTVSGDATREWSFRGEEGLESGGSNEAAEENRESEKKKQSCGRVRSLVASGTMALATRTRA